MDETAKTRDLPKTRIASLFIALNTFSFVLIFVAAIVGLLLRTSAVTMPMHISIGLIGSLTGLFALVAAMFYLITTGAAVREAVQENNLSMELYARTRQLKKETFPWCAAAIVLITLTTIFGAGTHVGKLPGYLHLGLAVLTLIAYAKTIRQIKKDFYKNKIIMADVLDCLAGPPGGPACSGGRFAPEA